MKLVGYAHCACCSDDCMSNDLAKPTLCLLCEEAGCEHNRGECYDDCKRTDALPEQDFDDHNFCEAAW